MEATYTPAQRNVLSVLHVGGTTNGIHSHTIDASRGCGQWCGNLQRFGNSQHRRKLPWCSGFLSLVEI